MYGNLNPGREVAAASHLVGLECRTQAMLVCQRLGVSLWIL